VACETIYVRFLKFFFQNPKNTAFYIFWVVAHISSNTAAERFHRRSVQAADCVINKTQGEWHTSEWVVTQGDELTGANNN